MAKFKVRKFKTPAGKSLYEIVDSSGRNKSVGGTIFFSNKAKASAASKKLK